MRTETPADSNRWQCTPQYPCRRFITCQHCAARRQARFADIAERIEAAFGPLQYAVITPDQNTAEAIRKAKHAAIRALTSPAAIWSIEVGEQAGRLHINLLGANLDFPKIRNATIHTETVRSNARAVAAYITKANAYPPAHQYQGRAVGTCGTVMQYLAEARDYPVAQAAALLQIIDTGQLRLARHQLPSRTDAEHLHELAHNFTQALEQMENAAYQLSTRKGTITQHDTRNQ
jgi:hypothetical protein